MSRIEKIRASEKQSHMDVYASETLYEGTTWLRKPVKTVLDLLPLFEGSSHLYVLDIGCGVGRNCIPIAQKYNDIDCQIDCVDLLGFAIDQLNKYSQKYEVSSHINGIATSIENFIISPGKYHLILAISALEHVESETCFIDMLAKIRAGVCAGGIVCFIINSNISETDKETGQECDVQFEVNMPTERLVEHLKRAFNGWEILKHAISRQQYDIPRERTIRLSTNVVTWVARKT